MSGVNIVPLSPGTAAGTYVTLNTDREFNVLIQVGTGGDTLYYTKSLVAQGLGTTPRPYVVDSRNPQQTSPTDSGSLIMDVSVNQERTLLTITLRNLANKTEAILFVYALRQIAEPAVQGEKGDKGDKGDRGERGEQGPQGPEGPQGTPGADGARGERGLQGAQGAQGIPGVKGDKGDRGDPGPAGPEGPQGVPGAAGERGPRGLQGVQGAQGQQGVPGPQGPPGVSSSGPVPSPTIPSAVAGLEGQISQEQYEELLETIASGASNIAYSGKAITYRSLEDMVAIARMARRSKKKRATLVFRNRRDHY